MRLLLHIYANLICNFYIFLLPNHRLLETCVEMLTWDNRRNAGYRAARKDFTTCLNWYRNVMWRAEWDRQQLYEHSRSDCRIAPGIES